ncbi:MAG: SDR family oxidoreductase [Chloroflexi bacterium]|nr:SDR family oxidoreductase [Chloroflexota bacterium]
MKLEKKVAVVTGAARGIGRAIAIRLAEEGARVVVSDVDLAFVESLAAKLRMMGRETLAIKADVSDGQAVETMFARVERRFGGADILVNNAGIRKDVPFPKISEKEWDSVIAVQLKGSFNCARLAQKYMVGQNYGKIVNLSSPVPASLGNRGQTSYASASAAIEGFTRALSLELGRYNINVNCVAPDFIDTEMTRNTARREGMYLNDFKSFALAQIPLRRLGTAEDVANVVLFLVSEESSFISGQVIYVRGGP